MARPLRFRALTWAAALAGAAAIFLAINWLSRPIPPFKFLEGRESHPLDDIGPRLKNGRCYIFEGDFSTLIATASKELKREGMMVHIMPDPREATFLVAGQIMAGDTPIMVFIHKDTALGNRNGAMGQQPGWIEVDVYNIKPPSVWERITTVFIP